MSVFTLEELDQQIAAYKQALLKLATHQSWSVDGMQFTRAQLPEIRTTLTWLDSQRQNLTRTSAGRTFAKQGGRG